MYRSKERLTLTALAVLSLVLLSASGAEAGIQRGTVGPESGWQQPLLKLERVWTELVAWWSGEPPSAIAKEGAGLSNGG